MQGYRNAVYNYKEKAVELHTWSDEGDRIVTTIPCYPYFYYEDNNGDEVSIFDTNLKKKSFNTIFDKTKFIKERGLVRLFDNYNPVQQTLIDLYWDKNHKDEFSQFPLKIFYIDIEAVGQNGFSHPSDPNEEINVITIYDSLSKKYTVWGTEQYNVSNQKNVKYVFCASESILLRKFIDYIQRDYPDIISGWNCDRYDIPYIINRIIKVLGEEEANLLSPYGRRFTKMLANKFGGMDIVHRIDGISCVDYMDIYKKFCPVNRESYKLDYIGQVELGESKVDYGDQSLYELMTKDWQTFVDYNIQDVKLLVNLEERLQYIQLLRMLSYMGCTTFESALGTVSVVTGAAAIEARKKKQRLCTFVVDEEGIEKFKGGFVAQPVAGHHTSIISFDANSLYPNTMITLNTSPETKIGRIINTESNKISIRNVDGIIVDFTLEEFKKYIVKEKISVSKARVLFSQKKKGILSDLVDQFYKKRVKTRSELRDIKMGLDKLKGEDKKNAKIKINQLDTKQQSIKIFINSVYGACGNEYCPLADRDIAESITLTGQAVIKESREIFKRFVQKETGNSDIKFLEKGLIAGDTDSMYVSIDQLISKFSIDENITKEAYDVAEKLQNYLNLEIKNWAERNLNTKDCRFEFKREYMCDAGIFLEKKRYVLHYLDKENKPETGWKYTGIEVVSTTMPKSIKPYVEKIIQNVVLTKSEYSTNEIFKEAYEIFLKMDISDISIVKGIKNLEKYEANASGFKTAKGTPCHVKAAYFYNLLLNEHGLDKKYEKITSGDKIKYFYLEQPNMYGIDAIAYKTRYPTEFNDLFKPDMYVMFEKDMYKCVERFYKVMNWTPRKPNEQMMISLDDIFS
jgi:DNA polymerase elongation subunit (family B)